MNHNERFINLYIDLAKRISEMSYAKRNKVGCVIVKNNNILSFGYNGTPTRFNNCCENEKDGCLETKPEVIHSEINAISKAAANGISIAGSKIFLTLSPCFECAKAIIQCKIKEVYYNTLYRDVRPLEMLTKANVKCYLITKEGEKIYVKLHKN